MKAGPQVGRALRLKPDFAAARARQAAVKIKRALAEKKNWRGGA